METERCTGFAGRPNIHKPVQRIFLLLNAEFAGRGITVNAIAPGFIQTDMTSELKEEMKAALLKQIPLGSFGEADDIAGAALYLASPAARYVTGQVLTVDGGMVM